MKTFILAAVAASLVATPAMAAPGRDHGRNDRVAVKTVKHETVRRGPQRTVVKKTVVKRTPTNYRAWSKGQRFDSRYARNYRVVSQPRNYRLYDAPRGYHWVQSGNDAVLVGIASGIIGAVIAGALN
ncbi:Ni/Co efflux regulator RcnB [Sphingomonas zeicaulis]|uniref:RcnB family protein n=1 Tax=Sphingomonas zeicaulis TaxID=1632740 RepID=UPI003D1B8474